MKRIFYGAAIAAFAFSGTAALAQDANRAPAGQSLSAIRHECMKQYGGYYDEARRRWRMPPAPYYISASRTDAIYNCVSQRTGKPPEAFLRERKLYGKMYD